MARGQGSPVRDKAEWLLRFAVMSLATPRDFRRLRLEAHRWLDPDGARPLEWAELRHVQAHIQGGLTALRQKQPWEETSSHRILSAYPGPSHRRSEARLVQLPHAHRVSGGPGTQERARPTPDGLYLE